MSIKIVQVIADSNLTGGPRHIVDLLSGFKDNLEFSFHLICPPGWLPDEVEGNQLASVNRLPMESVYSRSARRGIRNILEEIGPDLVHAHGTRAGILLNKSMPQKSAPLIYTEHRWTADFHLKNPIREWLQIQMLKSVGKRASKVVGVSRAVRNFLVKKGISAQDKIQIIHNSVFIPRDQKSYEVVSDEKLIIGAIGSLIPVKGFDLLINSVPKLIKEFPSLQIEIAGEGSQKEELESLTRQLGVDNNVTFLGLVKDIPIKLRAWDVFISTSVTESFGLVIAEAMASALPVVVTNFAASRELVTDDVGYIIERQEEQLVAAVSRMLRDSSLRQKFGQAGRRRIEANFSVARMIRKLKSLYVNSVK